MRASALVRAVRGLSNTVSRDQRDVVHRPSIRMTRSALEDILSSVGRLPAETGAMLGCAADGTIVRVRFDGCAQQTSATYTPDAAALNQILEHEWRPEGIDFGGFVHSHPRGNSQLSAGDRRYVERIFAAMPTVEQLALPIVQSEPDTGDGVILTTWVATRGPRGPIFQSAGLEITGERDQRIDWIRDPAFARVRSAVSVPLLARTRIVVVGVGGSAGFVENLVRMGVGEVILIDPDTVTAENLATQAYYRSEIGRPKAEALAERLRDINPDLAVNAIVASLDEIEDPSFEVLARRRLPHRPDAEVTLLCGCTDNFWAQARVNRLALNLGLPHLAAQVYPGGVGAEISFHSPGVTEACGRCVLGSRYRAWLEGGHREPGKSAGTPLASTDRLNATKAAVALALIHGTAPKAWRHDPASSRWVELLRTIRTRNLAIIRLSPSFDDELGIATFGSVTDPRLITDDTLWLSQEPEGPQSGFEPCADCGGTGDLRDAIGTIASSRLFEAVDDAPECADRNRTATAPRR